MLGRKNGLYAFESALHIFPAGFQNGVMDISTWNSAELWRSYYQDLADGHLFFAEDIFGFQFSIRNDGIYSFNSESGAAEKIADSIEEWAALVLNDYEFQTGFPFAHEWQLANRPLLAHERLFPKYPFVLGGKYELGNLVSSNAVYGMQFRGYVADQIKDLPEGTRVELVFNPQ
ncbi:SMI1/KNR4 family protein [Chitinimonas arctica]|uniref:SMI1/KNR4 family protein n=1 Tax=Chitinimonas arctica TaxID=2594795 RepID=A0A516SMM5_9NEIS|nr:SMI1/KNR4 family protein [Chitinimonas arctica]